MRLAPLIRRGLFGASLIAGMLASPAARADSGDPRRATIIVKALSFDLDLDQRIGNELVIAVVFKRGDVASEANAATWTRAFGQLGSLRVKSAGVRAVAVPFDAIAIGEAVQNQGVDVVLVCDGLDAELDAIVRVAHARKLVTVGAKRSYVEKGLVLGAFIDDDKPKIVVNLPAARQGGFRFSSAMLRLATLLK